MRVDPRSRPVARGSRWATAWWSPRSAPATRSSSSSTPTPATRRNLTRSPASSERYPSWSPDGSRVAFNSNRDGTHNLYLIDADGSNLRQLTREKRGIEAGMQSWTADGRWIYFGLFGGGPPRMCRIQPDGSGFKVVGEGIDPAVSPDGKTDRRLLGDPGRRPPPLRDGRGRHECPPAHGPGQPWAGVHAAWTPDGRGIIYADRGATSLELFVAGPDGSGARQLTRLGGAATSPGGLPGRQVDLVPALRRGLLARRQDQRAGLQGAARRQAAGLGHAHRRFRPACDRAAPLPDDHRRQPRPWRPR